MGNGALDLEKQNTGDLSQQSTLSTESSLKTTPSKESSGFKVNPRVISDAIIGLSDGLTVPFALTAGLSAFGDKRVVIFGGLAELIAGAISMGLGGYLGAKSEAESYRATVKETELLVAAPQNERERLITAIFATYGVPASMVHPLSQHLNERPEQLLGFLMHFHQNLVEPAASRAATCAATIALGYFLGGFIPLIPYFCVGSHEVTKGLECSVGVMVFCLFAFGYGKTGIVSGWHGKQNVVAAICGGLQMVFIGGAAAGAAMGLVKAFNSI
ncbi:MAG: hypothetical protein M1825_003026 [Sarcosagium campestre]|nr:MAG: hypothetical protein M1825_003026 [Sarcosagium campestre]